LSPGAGGDQVVWRRAELQSGRQAPQQPVQLGAPAGPQGVCLSLCRVRIPHSHLLDQRETGRAVQEFGEFRFVSDHFSEF